MISGVRALGWTQGVPVASHPPSLPPGAQRGCRGSSPCWCAVPGAHRASGLPGPLQCRGAAGTGFLQVLIFQLLRSCGTWKLISSDKSCTA